MQETPSVPVELLQETAAACSATMSVLLDEKHLASFTISQDGSLFGSAMAHALQHNIELVDEEGGKEGWPKMLSAATQMAASGAQRLVAEGCSPQSFSSRVVDVMQVGAHVGDSRDFNGFCYDPIFNWLRYDVSSSSGISALLFEPVRDSFEQLVDNYRGSEAEIRFVHGAIVTTEVFEGGEEPFVVHAPPSAHVNTGIASMDRAQAAATMETLYSQDSHASLGSEVISATDWVTAFRAHRISAIGWLQLDVEGLDCDLLLDFPLSELRPNVIAFEHRHCDGSHAIGPTNALARPKYERTVAHLKRHGYEVTHGNEEDIIFALVRSSS